MFIISILMVFTIFSLPLGVRVVHMAACVRQLWTVSTAVVPATFGYTRQQNIINITIAYSQTMLWQGTHNESIHDYQTAGGWNLRLSRPRPQSGIGRAGCHKEVSIIEPHSIPNDHHSCTALIYTHWPVGKLERKSQQFTK